MVGGWFVDGWFVDGWFVDGCLLMVDGWNMTVRPEPNRWRRWPEAARTRDGSKRSGGQPGADPVPTRKVGTGEGRAPNVGVKVEGLESRKWEVGSRKSEVGSNGARGFKVGGRKWEVGIIGARGFKVGGRKWEVGIIGARVGCFG